MSPPSPTVTFPMNMMTTNENAKPLAVCHVVAMPYPGRSHINALMNICKRLACRKSDDILITFVVTEEWLGLIGSDPKPENIRFSTVPNVIPSEHGRAKDLPGFIEAAMTKLEAPFEEVLDGLHDLPASVIVADSFLIWAFKVAMRRNIPVASFWPLSASLFSVFYHFDLLQQYGHYPVDLSERGHEVVDYIPGVSQSRLVDLSSRIFRKDSKKILERTLEAISMASKAQYVLSTSAYELESQVFDVLKDKFPCPLYPIGPNIAPSQLENSSGDKSNIVPEYLLWLDSQPKTSVLYISFGSFLSVSSAQLDEIIAGVRTSGTRYIWVERDNASKIKEGCGDVGFVVPWCDQLRVLCHPSIGGFWTHCGWNSTVEGTFAGVPMLTYPIVGDQMHNSKQIVEDWKIGYKVNKSGAMTTDQNLVTRDEISELVKKLMDIENTDGKIMRKRAEELQEACRKAIAKGGSSDINLDAFIRDISQGHVP